MPHQSHRSAHQHSSCRIRECWCPLNLQTVGVPTRWHSVHSRPLDAVSTAAHCRTDLIDTYQVGHRPRPRLPPGFLSASQQEATKEPDSHPMSGSRTSNLELLGEGLRPPRRVSTTLPGGRHSRQKSPCSSSSAPLSSARQQIHRCKCRRRKDSVAANRHRSGVLVVCSHRSRPEHMYRQSWRITATDSRLEWLPPLRPAHRFWGYGIGTMGPRPLMRTGTFQVWGCCGNLCRQPSNQRACRVFFPCPLARGWVAGLARRILRQGTRTRSGRLQSDDSDPSPARCKLKKQTSPTSCSSLLSRLMPGRFATRKNPARHASLVRQPRPITVRTHLTVGSMSPLPRRLRLVRRTDAIGFQNQRGMRLNRRGGAGIVRLFFFPRQ